MALRYGRVRYRAGTDRQTCFVWIVVVVGTLFMGMRWWHFVRPTVGLSVILLFVLYPAVQCLGPMGWLGRLSSGDKVFESHLS